MKYFLVIILTILLIASSTSAFDGNRQGFVLGGGLGFAPSATWSLDGASSGSISGAGIALNFVIGYAWDNYNMIVYEGNVVGYKPSSARVNLTQGLNGASWYHYFGEPGKSAFSTIAVGFYVFNADGYNSADPGGAFMIGGGYEFSKHWQVGAYFSAGKTSDPYDDFKHSHFSILVTGVAF